VTEPSKPEQPRTPPQSAPRERKPQSTGAEKREQPDEQTLEEQKLDEVMRDCPL
jgi:hypothetical protein